MLFSQIEDFKNEIKYSAYAGEISPPLDELLELAIRKEILIQEAQRQDLDKKESFMRAIERHWKQTLVKELLDKETEAIYRNVREDEQIKALDNWIDELIKEADIA